MVDLNHIYKIVWNRARACWQVVSELAKNNGRVKSSRRQRRETQSNAVVCRTLTAALAVTLACSVGLFAPVTAAEPEQRTYAEGSLYTDGAQSHAYDVFKKDLTVTGAAYNVFRYPSLAGGWPMYIGAYNNFTLVSGQNGNGSYLTQIDGIMVNGPAGDPQYASASQRKYTDL